MMVFDRVSDIIQSQLGTDDSIITADTDIIEDLGADSVDIAELIATIEDEFALPPTDRTTEDIHTVGQLVEFIESLI
ncbi:MAG: acyl carrier protein [Oscillospiraceae bacterium]